MNGKKAHIQLFNTSADIWLREEKSGVVSLFFIGCQSVVLVVTFSFDLRNRRTTTTTGVLYVLVLLNFKGACCTIHRPRAGLATLPGWSILLLYMWPYIQYRDQKDSNNIFNCNARSFYRQKPPPEQMKFSNQRKNVEDHSYLLIHGSMSKKRNIHRRNFLREFSQLHKMIMSSFWWFVSLMPPIAVVVRDRSCLHWALQPSYVCMHVEEE